MDPVSGATATELQTKESQPPAAKNERPVMTPRIGSFNGAYLTGLKRRIRTTDEGGTSGNRSILSTLILEGPSKGILQAVIGVGNFRTTDEEYITCRVQYAPGRTVRVTFSAQNCKPVLEFLKGKVDERKQKPNEPMNWKLYKELTVSAYGTPLSNGNTGSNWNNRRMASNSELMEKAINATELFVYGDNGEVQAIVGPAPDTHEPGAVADAPSVEDKIF